MMCLYNVKEWWFFQNIVGSVYAHYLTVTVASRNKWNLYLTWSNIKSPRNSISRFRDSKYQLSSAPLLLLLPRHSQFFPPQPVVRLPSLSVMCTPSVAPLPGGRGTEERAKKTLMDPSMERLVETLRIGNRTTRVPQIHRLILIGSICFLKTKSYADLWKFSLKKLIGALRWGYIFFLCIACYFKRENWILQKKIWQDIMNEEMQC